MKITIKMEWKDFLSAQLLHRHPDNIGKIINAFFYLWGIVYVLMIINLAVKGRGAFIHWIPILLCLIVFPLIRFVLLPYQTKQLYSQHKEFQSPIEIEFAESGIKTTNLIGSSDRPYSFFHHWKEDKNLFLIYVSENSPIILPKRFMVSQDEIVSVRSILEKKIENKIPKVQRMTSIFLLGIILVIALIIGIINR